MITIEQAIILAVNAQSGQTDLEGKPAILHPLRVMLAGETYDEQIVGVLHDVVEDSELDFSDLKEAGCTEVQLEALKLLTHEKEIQYLDYVQRIASSGNRAALMVKLHDLEDNLERGRKYGHWKIVKKHEQALGIIRGAVT